MVKRFENNTTNTLEDIKVLDKGKVWIKATGEIRLDNYFYNLQLILLVPIFLFRTYLFSLVHSCPFLVINDLIHHYLV